MSVKENTPEPLVSIVILNWNGIEDTKLCLKYVRKLDYSNYEIIVVDNGSSSEEKRYLSRLKDIIYVDNPINRGFAGGQADGYKHSSGEFILLLNNDAVIDSSYLKKAIPMFNDEKVAVVGGRSYFWNEEEKLNDTMNRFYSYMTVNPITAETDLQMSDYGIVQEVNTVSGSAAIVRRSIIEQVGYLWEPFFAYYEETDLFARIKRAGYKILYNPKLHIWHKNGASSGAQGGSLFFYYHIFRNRYMYAMRNFDDTHLKLFRRSYLSQAVLSFMNIFTSKSHRRIAQAYVRSIIYILRHRNALKLSRNNLKQELKGGSYSLQVIKEQLAISVVVDATKSTRKQINSLIRKLSGNSNPLHEYILVTHLQDFQPPLDIPHSIRIIVDRLFFESHPINLGCIAARNEWLYVTDPSSLTDMESCLAAIADIARTSAQSIDLGEKSIVLRKSLYELMGGFQHSSSVLSKNISAALAYSHAKKVLISDSPPSLNRDTYLLLRAQIQNDIDLSSEKNTSRWHVFLSQNYHLAQAVNVLRWFLTLEISLRRKLGRLKNFILSTLTLDRKRLATELRYVREELYAERERKRSAVSSLLSRNKREEFTKKQLSHFENLPVFIICFERVKDLKALVLKLETMGLKKIVFIDNDSTYAPLLEYLRSTPYQVIPLQRNVGHTSPWTLNIIRILIPYGYYIVTDPDVIPTDLCVKSEPIKHLLDVLKKFPAYIKVGFGLKIDDLPKHYPLRDSVISWEKQFWQTEVAAGIFEAGVDTTFALYKPGTYTYSLHPSLRTGEPFIARHMPWYASPAKQSDEDIYYRLRADTGITSWNVDELPERYKKEMPNE